MNQTQSTSRSYSFKGQTKLYFDDFIKKNIDYNIYDLYETLYKDWLAVKDPGLYFLPTDKKKIALETQFNAHLEREQAQEFQLGSWIVSSLEKEVFHLIDQLDYLELRTIRNRNLITWEEQQQLYSKKIVLIGLSVGSNVLVNLVRMGIGNTFTLVDYDFVESHNLNRTQYTLRNIGLTKLQSSAQIVTGVDPYIKQSLIERKMVGAEDQSYLAEADVIIDAFDHFEGKISLREKAKKHRKPVISGWDVGSGTVIIVERYDLDDALGLNIFLNNIPLEEVLKPTTSLREKIDIFIKIIGKETHDERMLASVYSIGQQLTGIPQHIVATSLTSAIFTQVISDIILKKSSASFRNYLDLNTLIY